MKTIKDSMDVAGYRNMSAVIPETVDEARKAGRLIGRATLGNGEAFASVYVTGWVHPHTYVSVVAHKQCESEQLFTFELRDDATLEWRLDDNGTLEVASSCGWWASDNDDFRPLFWDKEVNGFQFNVGS